MTTFLWIIAFCLLVSPIYANFTIVQQTPINTTYATTRQFIIQINQTVNRPSFSANITFYYYNNNSNVVNTTITSIDVHVNTSNVTYVNNTLMFYIPDSVHFNTSDEFYITFDVGVLYSNGSNSSALTDPQFWHLKVISSQTTTTTTTVALNTSMTTTTSQQTTYPATTMNSTSTSTAPSSNTTSTTGTKITAGESSPTRSAQLGMGLGITFITILIVAEILYFKYCYTASGRGGTYQT